MVKSESLFAVLYKAFSGLYLSVFLLDDTIDKEGVDPIVLILFKIWSVDGTSFIVFLS